MTMELNSTIKARMRMEQVTVWQLADRIGISENTLYRWFHHELTDEHYEKVQTALRDIITNRATGKGMC